MPPPVIFLAFANEKQSNTRYLRGLAREQAFLKESLEPAIAAGLCEVVIESNATVTSIITTFQRARYRDRIAIFHYGGHADGYQLLLESLDGGNDIAHGAGLVSFLSKQVGLRLIFLNGCSTLQQAKELVEAGVPAVIGTSQSIADDIATQLAARFYKSLGQGGTLDRSWQEAEDEVKIRSGGVPSRGILLDMDLKEEPDHFPWEMYLRKGADIVRDWNLPQAAGNPLYGLPTLSQDSNLPEEPYRFLRRFERRHAALFFGRGAYIRDVYQRLTDTHSAPVLLLYGQSGVGKSSLLEAGVLPRLEQSCTPVYLRRDPNRGLTATLTASLATDSATLKQAWKERESSNGRPLLIILDQMEEVYTRPREGDSDELPHFMQLIQQLFDNPRDRPTGRLVLSYRKEYHPEIEAQCRQLEIPREKIFIDKLDRSDIIEVVNGLTSSKRLSRRYPLRIEENLPAVIADDLLADPNSAIAPVLQILLTKMWELASAEESPSFTIAKYNELRKAGILLDDFYAEQMAVLQSWMPTAVNSGLALDLLHLHTTSMGTAGSRDLEEIRRLYQHQEEGLDQLLSYLKDLYLLTEVNHTNTGLTHDALAPIVQREIKDSDKSGQRALRILSSKIPEYEYQPEKVYIDEEDLILVERGAGGMRLWTAKERELIEKSRERRAKLKGERVRNQRLKSIGMMVISLLAIVSSVLGIRAYQKSLVEIKQARASQLVSSAIQQKEIDPTQAYEIVEEALMLTPDNKNALEVRRDIYEKNEFYKLAREHPASVQSVGIAADGSYWISAGGKKIIRWDKEGMALDSFITEHEIYQAILSPVEDQLLVLTRESNSLLLVNTQNWAIKSLQGHSDWAISAAFSEDGQQIVTGGRDGEVTLWELKSGQIIKSWNLHSDIVRDVHLAKERGLLISGGDDLMAYLIDLRTGKVNSFEHNTIVRAVSIPPTGAFILTGSEDGILHRWNLNQPLAKDLVAHNSDINTITYHPDGRHFLTASNDQKIRLWNNEGILQKTYQGHADGVQDLAFAADGHSFISGSQDGSLRIWDTDAKGERRFDHPGRVVYKVVYADDGHFVTAIGNELYEVDEDNLTDAEYNQIKYKNGPQSVIIWDTNGTQKRELKGHAGYISALAVSRGPAHQYLTGGEDAAILLWNKSGEITRRFTGHKAEVNALAFSPSNKSIASAGSDSTVYIWNISGDIIHTLKHQDLVSSLAFSPDGTYLLSGSYDSKGRIWDTASGDLITEITLAGNRIESVAFSNNNAIALGTSNPATISVFQTTAQDHQVLFEQTIHAEGKTGKRNVTSLSFSPDGQQIAVAAHGSLVTIFDMKGEPIREYRKFNNSNVYSIAYSPGGESILVGSGDGQARILKVSFLE